MIFAEKYRILQHRIFKLGSGRRYPLCWGFDPKSIADYTIVIDANFELVGPEVAEFFCTLGIPCYFPLSGYRLDARNEISLSERGMCDEADAVKADWFGIIPPVYVNVSYTCPSSVVQSDP